MTEHRISVNNGKYTFVVSPTIIKILRYGEPWHHGSKGQSAIHSLICELDAARVVLQAADSTIPGETDRDRLDRIEQACERYRALVGSATLPSEWTK